jgi:hypothetical protein
MFFSDVFLSVLDAVWSVFESCDAWDESNDKSYDSTSVKDAVKMSCLAYAAIILPLVPIGAAIKILSYVLT